MEKYTSLSVLHPSCLRVSIMPSVQGIAQSASAIQANQVHSQVQTAVAKKQLDSAKLQGDAAVQLIQQAANISKTLDVRV